MLDVKRALQRGPEAVDRVNDSGPDPGNDTEAPTKRRPDEVTSVGSYIDDYGGMADGS